MAKKISFEDSFAVLRLYWAIINAHTLESLLIVGLGGLIRFVAVVVYVLVLKIFLFILAPDSTSSLISRALEALQLESIMSNSTESILLGLLTLAIVIQFLANKIKLALMARVRAKIMLHANEAETNEDIATHVSIVFQNLCTGYEATTGILEILVFYLVLISTIFIIAPLLGTLVIVVVPILLLVLILKRRKEIFMLENVRESQKVIKRQDKTPQRIEQAVVASNQHYLHVKNSAIYTDTLGAVALVLMMVAFITFGSDVNAYDNLIALFLAFCIRFSITYTAELSHLLSRLLRQRAIIEKIDYVP